jgi:copper chaperone NosL
MKNLKPISRIGVSVATILIGITYFVPIWQILMWAPQYPEGLEMKIWLNDITGDYKTISGLNHYIGMKHIEVSMFPEFTYLVYIVAVLILIGVVTVITKKKHLLYIFLSTIILAGAAGLLDFYKWGYDYGHNLDPRAPIIVPGMAYQPPLIGTKQLLNFTAYSGPDVGGYLFLASGIILISVGLLELGLRGKVQAPAIAMILVFFCSACDVEPEALHFGDDACSFCKMTLMDEKFGAEVVTAKGKIFKFDDINCMLNFIKDNNISDQDVKFMLVTDYQHAGKLLDVNLAYFLSSDEIRSPMGGNVAAFSSVEYCRQVNNEVGGSIIGWQELKTGLVTNGKDDKSHFE